MIKQLEKLILTTALFWFLLAAPTVRAADANVDDENDLETALAVLGGAHLGGTLTALIPEPFTAFAGETIAYGTGLALKGFPASFIEPSDRSFAPTSPDQCTYDFELPQGEALYSTIYGIPNPFSPFPSDWGPLGTPQVFHFNTEVGVSIHNSILRPAFTGRNGEVVFNDDGEIQGVAQALNDVSLPAGRHNIEWRADTVVDIGLDIALPTAMYFMAYSKFKAAKSAPAAAAGNADEAAKQVGIFKKAGKWMVEKLQVGVRAAGEKAAELYILGLVDDATGWEAISATKRYNQQVTVYDELPPVVTYNGISQVNNAVLPTITLEATDFGGVQLERVIDELREDISVFDPCNRPAGLSNDLPDLLRIGSTSVTWTGTDTGPTFSGNNNRVFAYQTIIVEDTQAPIMVTPPGKVIEIDPNVASNVDAETVQLGVPRVVDLADATPRIFSDAPATFPINSRTPVVWTAEDASGNASTGNQLITVKPLGTNTAPTVFDVQAETLTSEPVDIVLTGSDTDLIDGVFDPLEIRIESRPNNGDFVAPLLPFFIEDYRSSPTGPYGEEFALLPTGQRDDWLYDNVCNNPDFWVDEDGNQINANYRIRRDFPYQPQFIHVEDSGDYFLIDRYWQCDMAGTRARTIERLSKWNAENEFLGAVQYGGTSNTFVQDQDGFLYVFSRGGAGTSTRLFLTQIFSNLEDASSPGAPFNGDSWTFDFASTENDELGLDDFINPESLSYARVDSANGLIYVTDRRRVFVFDVRADFADGVSQSDNSMEDKYRGALRNGEQFLCQAGQHGNSWTGFPMEVDSEGSLYVADTCNNRIHKFEPSYFDGAGDFVMGDYVGWMGRCDSSTNNACDVENGRSRGYACTDETCVLPDRRTEGGLNRLGSYGTEPGQFAGPVFMDLDPNDVLYVADSGRVQRFAKDGTPGGQARSTGTGINQGDQPGFILGNMGRVSNVTVNSTNFYVVDQDESFVHVFETTPLKDITDSSATVTYVSNFNFHNEVEGGFDSFTFLASDGLAESGLGTVSVQVNRNFRPPEVFSQALELDEDTTIDLTLTGDDPDGVIGSDDVYPLDSLTFRVTESPSHGSLSGTGINRTYTPDADFFGEDRFEFVANDGVFDSEPGEVVFTVTAVDDQPVIERVILPEKIGRGFPVTQIIDYSDDGGPQPANAFVNWGAEATDSNGDFVDPDGPDGPEPARLEGIKIVEPVQGVGVGRMVSDHTFASPGPAEVFTCVATGSVEGSFPCASESVMVEELVSLDVRLTAEDEETTGAFIDLELSVTNVQPEGWSGLNANNVSLVQVTTPEIEVAQIVSQSGACDLSGGVLTCDAASLAPGESFSATIRVVRTDSAALIYDLGVPVAIDVTTTSNALLDEHTAASWVTFLADTSDSDGDGMSDVFEEAYGLNPNSGADAALDADGDRLTNLEEFEAQTNPTLADTDGDGARDDEDYCPLDPEGAVEGTDGLCEQDIRSSPVLRIIQLLSERERR
ncbi:MAG: Ig-like domain-containing protein [Pseudomonadaceae bacterium]|nr:Ig-like domain-containing protein [Pseudomonadaceae bacterium]